MVVKETGKLKTLIGTFLFIAIFLGPFKPSAEAASAADFYKDKKITFISADKAGGGTDIIVRIVAPYLKKHTGANAVIVENLAEGGGMLALNRLWNSKPDGLTLSAHIMSTAVMMEANKEPGVQYQCDKFSILFALSSEKGNVLLVNAKGPFGSVDDLKKQNKLKSAGPTGKALSAAYFADVLGLDAKVTPGMTSGDARMALLRGEIDFFPDSTGSAVDQVRSGAMRALCIDLSAPSHLLPDVPSVAKFVSFSPQQKEWAEILDYKDNGKFVFAGPNVPKERIEYLRSVFEKIHQDPAFLEDRKKFERLPGGEPWLNYTEAQKSYAHCLETTAKGYIQMFEYLSKKYYTVK